MPPACASCPRGGGGGGGGGGVRALVPRAGGPTVTVFGSRGWLPNEESTVWFAAEVWPVVRAALPGAVLHLFGAPPGLEAPGVAVHPSPEASGGGYPTGW